MADETKAEEQDDPIVAEVRAARLYLLEKYGGLEGYLRNLREVHAQRLERERDEAERREAAELGKSA
ncbi:MAG: hypothetical protein WED27_11470 [Pirellulales bacterium]